MNYLFCNINRYFCRQFLLWFFVILLSITFIVGFFEGIELIRRGMSKPNVTLDIIGEMVVLKIPNQIQTLLPFIILFSGVFCLWRLNQTQEIVAVRAMGVSVWQIIGGMATVVIMIGLINLLGIDSLRSAMTSRLLLLEENAFGNTINRVAIASEGIWFKEVNDDKQTIIHAKHFDLNNRLFKQISFFEFDNKGKYISRLESPAALLHNNLWFFEKVSMWSKDCREQALSQYERPTNLSVKQIQESNAPPESLSFWQIPDFIKILERAGLSSLRYNLYWHKQMARVAMMVSMLFFAAVFCLYNIRYRNTSLLIAVGLMGGFAIHFLQDLIYIMGLTEKIPIFLAAWFPSIFTLLFSSFLLLHTEDG